MTFNTASTQNLAFCQVIKQAIEDRPCTCVPLDDWACDRCACINRINPIIEFLAKPVASEQAECQKK